MTTSRSARSEITVLITTKDRRDDLRRALRSVLEQDVEPSVLVFDDGSLDGTSEMVRREFPGAVVAGVDSPLGIVAARNRGIGLCRTRIVVTIDDDCVLPDTGIIRQVLRDFDHPRIAAVSIPHYNPGRDTCPSHSRGEPRLIVSEFTGCANAVDREVFEALRGYREELCRQTEETDFCTRLINAGFLTCYGTSNAIEHFETPRFRNYSAISYYIVRNRMIYAWTNVPGWKMPIHLLATTVGALSSQFRAGFPGSALKGFAAGLGSIANGCVRRRPVSPGAYTLFRRLRKKGPLPLSEVLDQMESLDLRQKYIRDELLSSAAVHCGD